MIWTFIEWITSWNNNLSQKGEVKLDHDQEIIPDQQDDSSFCPQPDPKLPKPILRSKPIKIKQTYKVSREDRYQIKKIKNDKKVKSNEIIYNEDIFLME